MIWLPSGFLRAAVPQGEPQVEQPADDWCPRCRIHRVRQDTYSGAPVYVALCPVCASEPEAACNDCGDPLIPGEGCRCTEGYCASCYVLHCASCRQDLADDMAGEAAVDRWRLM